MREFALGRPLAPELSEGEIHFGGDEASIHTGSISAWYGQGVGGFPLDEVVNAVGGAIPADFLLYKRFRVWGIPHHLSVVRRLPAAVIDAVSVELRVEFQATDTPCSVAALVPSFEYVVAGQVKGEVEATGELNLAGVASAITGVPAGLIDAGVNVERAGLKFNTQGGAILRFRSTLVTPKIAAMGLGSKRAEWRFDRCDEPIIDRTLLAWTFLVLPKRQRELKYNAQFAVVTRSLFVPSRRESDWHEFTIPLSS